jgi:hypothetical protein
LLHLNCVIPRSTTLFAALLRHKDAFLHHQALLSENSALKLNTILIPACICADISPALGGLHTHTLVTPSAAIASCPMCAVLPDQINNQPRLCGGMTNDETHTHSFETTPAN